MKSLQKIGKLKLIGLGLIVPVLIAGTAVAYNIATPPKTTNESTQAQQDTQAEKAEEKPTDNELEDTKPIDNTANESTDSTPIQSTAQTTETSTVQSTQNNTTPTPTPPTCNESMKASYTSLYNSQVNAENASWANQITAWNNYAAANGLSFSGYVQDQINQNKPAHDARLAQYQTQYYQNLISISCNP